MLEDLSLMRTLPNMTVLSVSDDTQARWAVKEIAKIDGPVYLRLARLATPVIYGEDQQFEMGKAIEFGTGTDGTVIATGVTVAEALSAKEELEKQDIHIRVLDVHTIKPIDREAVIKVAKETQKIVTIEDHSIIGGLGSTVCEVLTEEYPCHVTRLGVKDTFGRSGSAEELMKEYGIDSLSIQKEFLGK